MSAATGTFSQTYLRQGVTKDKPLYPHLTARIVRGRFPYVALTSVAVELQKARRPREEVEAFRSEALALARAGRTTDLDSLLVKVMRLDPSVGEVAAPPLPPAKVLPKPESKRQRTPKYELRKANR